MIKLAVLLVILAFSSLFSQDGGLQHSASDLGKTEFDDVPTVLKNKVHVFYNTLQNEQIEKAYEELLTNSPIKKNTEDLNNLIIQTKRAIGVYGKIHGYEPVSAELVSNSYIRLNYLGIHSNYPVRWIFTYYRSPKHDWIITSIKFDDLSEFYFKQN